MHRAHASISEHEVVRLSPDITVVRPGARRAEGHAENPAYVSVSVSGSYHCDLNTPPGWYCSLDGVSSEYYIASQARVDSPSRSGRPRLPVAEVR